MLISLLAVGFALGLRHALDADHVTAVASLAARRASLRETLRIAASWGLGHAAALLVFGAALVLLGARLPDRVAALLEGAVGVMLVVLGVSALLRARRARLHVHLHAHDQGEQHLHVHAHEGDRSRHEHPHALAPRALLIGCVHGLAGTAGLALLALPAVASGAQALLYLVVFGAGTVAGMVGFSLAISVPLAWSARRLRRAAFLVEAGLGMANVALGIVITFECML